MNGPHTRESELRDLKAKFMAWNVIPDLEGYLKATHGMIPFDWALDAMRRISAPMPLTPSDEMVTAGLVAFNATINDPIMDKCITCDGKGFHHGVGEDGASPDWCIDCGGGGFHGRPGEEHRAMKDAITAALNLMGEKK